MRAVVIMANKVQYVRIQMVTMTAGSSINQYRQAIAGTVAQGEG